MTSTAMIAFLALGCSEGDNAPCEAADIAGLWTVAYEVPAATTCNPGIDDDLRLTAIDADTLAIEYRSSAQGEFDGETCTVHATSHAEWTAGGEAWWDDRDLTLAFSNDQGVGTLLFLMSWNCVGNSSPVEFAATATRQVE